MSPRGLPCRFLVVDNFLAPDVAARLRCDTVAFHRQGWVFLNMPLQVSVMIWAFALYECLMVEKKMRHMKYSSVNIIGNFSQKNAFGTTGSSITGCGSFLWM